MKFKYSEKIDTVEKRLKKHQNERMQNNVLINSNRMQFSNKCLHSL